MDLISNEALAGLRDLLEGMLPGVTNPAHEPRLSFAGTRITPIGLGGFIAVNDDPKGAIYGRRIETGAVITVKSADDEQLSNVIGDITEIFLTQDRQTLFQNGLCRIELNELGPVTTTGQGNNMVSAREVNFSVLYEYVKLPDAPEGVMDEIPLDFDLDLSEGSAQFLINTGFDENSLDLFDVVDDPLAVLGGSSDWAYNAGEFRIEQLGDTHGGDLLPSPDKAGTYLLLKQTAQRPLVQDFVLSAEIASGDPDGVGFVFRFQDTDNFYYFLISARHNYRLMGKKIAGEFSALDTPGLDDTQGFDINEKYQVKLIVQDSRFTLFIDDDLALQGEDSSITQAAKVGFACHNNNQAFFYRIKLIHFQA
jgi:hypothetical protein